MSSGHVNAINSSSYQGNYCLSFDGVDDYVGCSSLDAYNATEFTIELWIKPKYPIQNGSDLVYGQWEGGLVSCGYGWSVSFAYDSGELKVTINVANIELVSTYPARQTWDPSWYHIAVTYNANSLLRIYVNATLILTSRVTELIDAPIGYNFTDLRIGAVMEGFPSMNSIREDTSFAGLIDEVRYWNVCRSSVEISNTYNRILEDTELNFPELVGYWRFDEGTGTLSQDYSLQHNNAILAASPSDPSWVDYGAPIIPEFPSLIILQLFMIATLLAAIAYRRKYTR